MKQWQQILLAMILGVVVGHYLKQDAKIFEPLGKIFLNLIKMITIPMIFFTLIYGITNIESGKDVRRIGTKAIVVFMLTSAFAVVIGM